MNTIGVLTRPELHEAGPALAELVDWLRARGVRVCLEESTAALVPEAAARACTVADGATAVNGADAVVVLGGDGTLLRAAHLLQRPDVPVLGVNFGSLGFLTEVTLGELFPTLEGLLAGRYAYDERTMLRAALQRAGEPEASGDALNDVVVLKASAVSRIIELDVSVDGVFVSSFRADGLIVASPTGSTAYNLAAGGPILQPGLAATVVTPICPHALTNRPLVIGDRSAIEVRLRTADIEVHATLDGQEAFPLRPDDCVRVTRSPRVVRLVRAPERDYFEVLRTKLKWGESNARSRGR
jgi:NAD+ kinase